MALTDELSSRTLAREENKKSTEPKYVEELIAAVRRQSVLSLELLLQHIDVNARDLRDGRTAISVAAEIGNVEITKLLIKHRASVNIRQYSLSKRSLGNTISERRPLMVSGRLPIYWAVTKRYSAVVKLLLEYGANPNARTTARRSVLQEACFMNGLASVRVLLEAGADVDGSNLSSGVHETANWGHNEVLRVLFEFSPLLDVPAVGVGEAYAPMHLSTRNRLTETTKLLLSNGADPNVLMTEDMTPLHLAASGGMITELDLLLDWGASINAQDARLRETPLHKAARNLETTAIKRLCERGADMDMKNIDGMTYQEVLECAKRYPNDWHVEPKLGSFCSFF
ncbi:uncharacterized protein N7446_010238 [Penicillium canescens]|uniref:Ankyrin n=1 Tax=Penicillium canescens TaxID=5083 RepID=A0AAD6I8Z8_PENCN|nr:uncharacterized protein N7446_010238 [Penicillium canescens]KAJ6035475.1 hypothetical protein N7460_009650 [Penicillium canescens]KAJ6037598.1 hypothetical protein N7444_010303 [Penicillium canescens]KAJ6054226.1 hypothetical protein N7446_010238 [Penicillium canescens]